MNWLAHFHFLPDDAHELAPIGTALADLAHDLERRLRAPEIVEALGAGNADARGIAAGARHHLAADAIFHDHPEVTARFTAVRVRLQGPEFAAIPRRREFVAHVLVEQALDAALHARDAGLPVRLAAAHAPALRLRARAAVVPAIPERGADACGVLDRFGDNVERFADSSPPALARRLKRTLVTRLGVPVDAVPVDALAALLAETIAGWTTGLPVLESALAPVMKPTAPVS